ncbi:histidine kinase [Catenulispora acidiphila DSM 44928]|uniref:Sensor histidine kinase MtrB n=1 Tax=Catenulispora acidiphila (strain DSM 44928 / JCM 14897 / NBRC 102108 / NRRL B-24433 / ID139908) TaxID=479433 RepID=C7QBC6_CATAD|nr:MtrAB system histidine kinase MtrB [Catenulispora acidiphila]ACU76417.1 histidine kinase [Catenulispora acidiphila DSM 44928]
MRVSKFTGGARRFGRAVLELPGTWRGSLQLRVVSLTLLLSIVIAFILGWVLNSKIRDGLVQAKESSSLAMVSSGFSEASASIAAASEGLRTTTAGGLPPRDGAGVWVNSLPTMVQNLCSGANSDTYQVILTSDVAEVPVLGYTCGGILYKSIPDKLPDKLQNFSSDGFQAQMVTTDLQYGVPAASGAVSQVDTSSGAGAIDHTTPGLIYGGSFTLPDGNHGKINLYYAFPFTTESDALNFDNEMIAIAGAVLVLALAGVAWFITRLVVTPVRQAAGIAERLADGRFDERMRVRGEDDLARLATSFNTMAGNLQRQIRKLEELSRVQRRFVSDVSHELRTPLTTVRMAADVLHDSREDFSGPTARSAELLQTQLDRFEELLGDLLEISRFDAGAAVLDAEPVDLRMLARRVVDSSAVLAERKGSDVRIVAPDTPCVAEIDPRRIERILRNLVVNSIEHSEGRPVVIKVAASGDAVAVAVRDYGVGLKPGESSLVFGRFWRADPARARTTGGTGLGLAISLEDAHLHHGWLQAWGEPGGGSQFRLTLPRTAGLELVRSPIPLEPDDSRHHKRQVEAARLAAEGALAATPRHNEPDLTGLSGRGSDRLGER